MSFYFEFLTFFKKIHCVYGVSMTRKQDSGKRGRRDLPPTIMAILTVYRIIKHNFESLWVHKFLRLSRLVLCATYYYHHPIFRSSSHLYASKCAIMYSDDIALTLVKPFFLSYGRNISPWHLPLLLYPTYNKAKRTEANLNAYI